MRDRLTQAQRLRLEALALAVSRQAHDASAEQTIEVASRYEKWLREGNE